MASLQPSSLLRPVGGPSSLLTLLAPSRLALSSSRRALLSAPRVRAVLLQQHQSRAFSWGRSDKDPEDAPADGIGSGSRAWRLHLRAAKKAHDRHSGWRHAHSHAGVWDPTTHSWIKAGFPQQHHQHVDPHHHHSHHQHAGHHHHHYAHHFNHHHQSHEQAGNGSSSESAAREEARQARRNRWRWWEQSTNALDLKGGDVIQLLRHGGPADRAAAWSAPPPPPQAQSHASASARAQASAQASAQATKASTKMPLCLLKMHMKFLRSHFRSPTASQSKWNEENPDFWADVRRGHWWRTHESSHGGQTNSSFGDDFYRSLTELLRRIVIRSNAHHRHYQRRRESWFSRFRSRWHSRRARGPRTQRAGWNKFRCPYGEACPLVRTTFGHLSRSARNCHSHHHHHHDRHHHHELTDYLPSVSNLAPTSRGPWNKFNPDWCSNFVPFFASLRSAGPSAALGLGEAGWKTAALFLAKAAVAAKLAMNHLAKKQQILNSPATMAPTDVGPLEQVVAEAPVVSAVVESSTVPPQGTAPSPPPYAETPVAPGGGLLHSYLSPHALHHAPHQHSPDECLFASLMLRFTGIEIGPKDPHTGTVPARKGTCPFWVVASKGIRRQRKLATTLVERHGYGWEKQVPVWMLPPDPMPQVPLAMQGNLLGMVLSLVPDFPTFPRRAFLSTEAVRSITRLSLSLLTPLTALLRSLRLRAAAPPPWLFAIALALVPLVFATVNHLAGRDQVPVTGRDRHVALTPSEVESLQAKLLPTVGSDDVERRRHWVQVLREMTAGTVGGQVKDGEEMTVLESRVIEDDDARVWWVEGVLDMLLEGQGLTPTAGGARPYDVVVLDKEAENAFSFGFAVDPERREGGSHGVIVVYSGVLDAIMASTPPASTRSSPPSSLYSGESGSSGASYATALPSSHQTHSLSLLLSHELAHLVLSHPLESLSNHRSSSLFRDLLADGVTCLAWPVLWVLGPFGAAHAVDKWVKGGTEGMVDWGKDVCGFRGVQGQEGDWWTRTPEMEDEADRVALKIMTDAGFDPRLAVSHWCGDEHDRFSSVVSDYASVPGTP